MLPSGVFVRADLEDLISNLPARLTAIGPPRLKVTWEPEDPGPEEPSVLDLSCWSDKWCLIEVTGPDELTTLVVASIVSLKPACEVLPCSFRPEDGEFSYTLFRDGRLMESFEGKGPSMESVNFTSELRRVQLQDLLRMSEFMIESLGQFGIVPGSGPATEVRKVRLHVSLPGKRSFWQALLGAVSPR